MVSARYFDRLETAATGPAYVPNNPFQAPCQLGSSSACFSTPRTLLASREEIIRLIKKSSRRAETRSGTAHRRERGTRVQASRSYSYM